MKIDRNAQFLQVKGFEVVVLQIGSTYSIRVGNILCGFSIVNDRLSGVRYPGGQFLTTPKDQAPYAEEIGIATNVFRKLQENSNGRKSV